jgi:hypothetical protein
MTQALTGRADPKGPPSDNDSVEGLDRFVRAMLHDFDKPEAFGPSCSRLSLDGCPLYVPVFREEFLQFFAGGLPGQIPDKDASARGSVVGIGAAAARFVPPGLIAPAGGTGHAVTGRAQALQIWSFNGSRHLQVLEKLADCRVLSIGNEGDDDA